MLFATVSSLALKMVFLWASCGRLRLIDTNTSSLLGLDYLRETTAMVIDSKTTDSNATDYMEIRGLSVRLGFRPVLKSEIVVFGLLIYRLQKSGLAFFKTDISDHVLGS